MSRRGPLVFLSVLLAFSALQAATPADKTCTPVDASEIDPTLETLELEPLPAYAQTLAVAWQPATDGRIDLYYLEVSLDGDFTDGIDYCALLESETLAYTFVLEEVAGESFEGPVWCQLRGVNSAAIEGGLPGMSPAGEAVSTTLDVTQPGLVVTGGNQLGDHLTVSVPIHVDDASPTTLVVVYGDAQLDELQLPAGASDVDYDWQLPADADYDRHSLFLRAVDAAGNASSLVFQYHLQKQGLVCYPTPFNPYGTTSLKFSFELAEAGPVDLMVYDLASQLVLKSAFEAVQGLNDGGVAVWDGRNGNGMVVADGVYTCVIRPGSGDPLVQNVVVRKEGGSR